MCMHLTPSVLSNGSVPSHRTRPAASTYPLSIQYQSEGIQQQWLKRTSPRGLPSYMHVAVTHVSSPSPFCTSSSPSSQRNGILRGPLARCPPALSDACRPVPISPCCCPHYRASSISSSNIQGTHLDTHLNYAHRPAFLVPSCLGEHALTSVLYRD